MKKKDTNLIHTEDAEIGNLYQTVREILESARSRVARSVNSEMVNAYWHIGQAIVEQEQQGKSRADYGRRLIELLSVRLKSEGLKGFGRRNLAWMREFYLKYPILHAVRAELSWTHYRLLLKVESDAAREFYETESVDASWSTRELERQINSFFFERTAASQDKRKMLEKGRNSGEKYILQDFIKDPFVLEFLNLKDVPDLNESELEQALLDHIQEFLLEMGKGFCFVGRQVRITIDGDHFYIDLVLSSASLLCFD